LAILGPGEIAGELATIDGKPRPRPDYQVQAPVVIAPATASGRQTTGHCLKAALTRQGRSAGFPFIAFHAAAEATREPAHRLSGAEHRMSGECLRTQGFLSERRNKLATCCSRLSSAVGWPSVPANSGGSA